ncbi:hypothetical protein MMC07_001418 [Pseudocyphellaria aurata]|nr:hypothetical protein [Pseudocyphellaria aurata]
MSVEAWANAARRDKYRQDFEHQRAIDAFQGLLDGNVTPDAAAGTIASLYEALIKHRSNTTSVPTLWGILCDAIRALGGNKELSERLVNLLNSISQLPDVTDEHGNVLTPDWKSAGVYWRDLPELAMMFREHGIGKSSSRSECTIHECSITDGQRVLRADIEPEDEIDGSWDAQAVPLLNATTFGAMYLARGKQPIGMLFHAEISLMHGIEVPYETPDQQRRAAMYVPPAATWILLAGEELNERCKNDYDRKDGAKGSTPYGDEWLWGKGRGYSLGRWELWKKRFGEIALTQGLPDDVKGFAARATSKIDEIDGQY